VLSRWPIRNKLLVGIALLLVIELTLSVSGFQGTYAYRELARSISSRGNELPLATALEQHVADLRVTLSGLEVLGLEGHSSILSELSEAQLAATFKSKFDEIRQSIREYSAQLDSYEHAEFRLGDVKEEREILAQIQKLTSRIEQLTAADDWYIDHSRTGQLNTDLLVQLESEAKYLPYQLQQRIINLAGEVRLRYRAWIVLTWICAVAATALVVVFIALGYRWIFRPLRLLVKGSRRVAGGDFNYRIELPSFDEMAELAEAMNAMTARFRAIRDDLDRQVQLRTRQVVRSEQLASVGFLAAGVAHEINNPLASIALCAESLEGRLADLAAAADGNKDQGELVKRYLKMIQTEAFRCKEITEKLLDFSRTGEVKRASADLRELTQSVIDMVRHLGRYQNRNIEFALGDPLIATVNAQEIKQVVLNLVTNALDSLDPGGTLTIELVRKPDFAEMAFSDNGCGMTEDVLEHLFEPFFTRKRGGQGTGLGLSIVYRIVSEHGGQIEATSAGPGRGSQFHVTLPLADASRAAQTQSQENRKQLAA